MDAKVFSQEGKETGKVTLPEAVFGVAWNADLVHEVVTGMQANARENNAHTKDRSEVRGGGKKPWKQKGTGRARHGSRRSPIWVGGGVAHGPRNERDYGVKINKKVRAKALACVLSKKFADQEVLFVDTLSFTEPKTKEARAIITALAKGADKATLATKRKNAAVVVLGGRNLAIEKSFRNFGHFEVVQAKDVNPVDLLIYKFVVVADASSSVEILEKRIAPAPKSK
ncbi:MAG: 50S ribosomal protein L4 [Candidatus Pacebacteria bacterium]|nr:50S ribosomal protein L4 [Candidatus Paceibacterota bacterium]